jgi:hypothetical protein
MGRLRQIMEPADAGPDAESRVEFSSMSFRRAEPA